MIAEAETETDFSTREIATETETDEFPLKEKSRRIPIHGSFSRPADPQEAVKEMIAARVPWKQGDLNVRISTDEFTSLCPTTGMPDFYQVEIDYAPDEFYLESKTVKYYFYAFREIGMHGEPLAQKILDDVRRAVSPKSIKVTVNQSPRGGLRIISEAVWSKSPNYTISLQPFGETELEKMLGNVYEKSDSENLSSEVIN